MRKRTAIFLALGLFASGFAGAAQAAGGHGGGHIGHSGGYFGHYRHGGYGYGYGYGAVGVGIGLGLGALYYGAPYGYGAYDYPDYPGDYYGAYGPPPPPDSDADAPDDENVPPDATNTASSQYWYHCDSPEGYYPYVKTCSHDWEPVPPVPPPPED